VYQTQAVGVAPADPASRGTSDLRRYCWSALHRFFLRARVCASWLRLRTTPAQPPDSRGSWVASDTDLRSHRSTLRRVSVRDAPSPRQGQGRFVGTALDRAVWFRTCAARRLRPRRVDRNRSESSPMRVGRCSVGTAIRPGIAGRVPMGQIVRGSATGSWRSPRRRRARPVRGLVR
jgi:hypothetical protein